jgi:hypothetical protein
MLIGAINDLYISKFYSGMDQLTKRMTKQLTSNQNATSPSPPPYNLAIDRGLKEDLKIKQQE